MAYFKSNEVLPEPEYEPEEEPETEYDDGFDDLEEEDVFPISEEERQERRRSRIRMFFGAGNLFGVVAGTVLILLLLTLIISMVYFVINDMGRSFSLFQTNF